MIVKQKRKRRRNPKHDFVDNPRLYKDVVLYLEQLKESREKGLPPPQMSNYIGKCMLLIPERLSLHPLFRHYSFRDEMISDAVENILMYFENYDINRKNVFAYWTQISYFAFQRRKAREKKNRYGIYKMFQETVLEPGNGSLMVDDDGKGLITPAVYDNINIFIEEYEDWDRKQKEKRKKAKGLDKYIDSNKT